MQKKKEERNCCNPRFDVSLLDFVSLIYIYIATEQEEHDSMWQLASQISLSVESPSFFPFFFYDCIITEKLRQLRKKRTDVNKGACIWTVMFLPTSGSLRTHTHAHTERETQNHSNAFSFSDKNIH